MDRELGRDEGDVADMFMDNDEGVTEEGMVESLRVAGLSNNDAQQVSSKMYAFKSEAQATFMEVYGRSIFYQSHIQRRNLNVQGLGALDLRTTKPNGQPWDFCTKADRQLARDMLNRLQPDWVIGAPPCTPFSIWNHGLNFKKMSPAKVKKMIDEGIVHLRFVCSLYRKQLRAGRYFLHEHPATAVSWREDDIKNIASHPRVQTVVGDQGMYGLVTPSEIDSSQMMPAMKATRSMSNSKIMLDLLSRRCDRSHVHQPLTGGRCKDAAFYLDPLVKAILKGMTVQKEQDRQLIMALEEEIGPMNAMPMQSPIPKDSDYKFGKAKVSKIPKVHGRSVPIVFNQSNFKSRYVDEYTGKELPTPLIRAAIEDELTYFHDKVWQLATKAEMEAVPDYILVRCSAQGLWRRRSTRSPRILCRSSQLIRLLWHAKRPSLQSLRATAGRRIRSDALSWTSGKRILTQFRKGRSTCVSLLKWALDQMWPQSKCVASMGRATQAACGKDTYTRVLNHAGFTTGVSNPCVFYHSGRDISIVVHGDDFTALGSDENLNWYED